jgi:Sec-independent protein translocase protein TatA
MAGISFSEFLVILTLAFLLVGPKKMAKTAHWLGAAIHKTKSQWEFLRQTKLDGVDASALYKSGIELNKTLNELQKPIHEPVNDAVKAP